MFSVDYRNVRRTMNASPPCLHYIPHAYAACAPKLSHRARARIK